MSCSSANRSTSPPGRVYDSSHQRGEAGSWCNTAVSLLTARNWYPTSIFQWKSVRVNALARPPCDLALFCGVFALFAVVFCWPKVCSPCWLRLLFRVANGPYGHPRVLPAHCLPLPIGAPTGPALDSPSVGVFCDGARTRLLRGGYKCRLFLSWSVLFPAGLAHRRVLPQHADCQAEVVLIACFIQIASRRELCSSRGRLTSDERKWRTGIEAIPGDLTPRCSHVFH